MWTWLSKMMWALRYVIRSAFAGPYVPLPTVPYKIASNPNHVLTGLNLVQNGGFETGHFGDGTETVVTGSGVIDNWLVLQDGGVARWIDAAHPTFSNAAEGSHFVDLTGGTPPGPTRTLATLFQNIVPSLQAGKSYEVSLDLGVGPFNGSFANFGPPVKVRVGVMRPPAQLDQEFLFNPLDYPTNYGVKWETFKFRFAIPTGYSLSQANQTIAITGTYGNGFIGVDNVSVQLLT